jgi:4-carboxymuconolactone decarboxylase
MIWQRRITIWGYCLMILLLTSEALLSMEKSTDRHNKGYETLKILNALEADKVQASLTGIAPDMGNYIIEFAYGDIYKTNKLDIKSRQIATVSALAALGNARPQLKWHIGASLNIGITPEEIIEIMYMTTVYHGFPAGLNGIFATKEVFEEKQIAYTPLKSYKADGRRARGLATMDKTSKGAGERVINSLASISPDISDFIINFAYGDVFSREILSSKCKEISAIAGMCATSTMRPQLKVHIKAGLNVGLTKEEIIEVLSQMSVYAGFPAALNGLFAAKEVFDERDSEAGK